MEALRERLDKRHWDKMCLRRNIATPDQWAERGSVRLALVKSNILRRDREKGMWELLESIAPEWYGEETKVILNKDVTCEPHRDSNDGHSWICFLGDFEGGELCFEDGTTLSEKGVWHRMNGRILHWNLPHTGTKYSVIVFRRSGTSCAKLISEHVKRKRQISTAAEEM